MLFCSIFKRLQWLLVLLRNVYNFCQCNYTHHTCLCNCLRAAIIHIVKTLEMLQLLLTFIFFFFAGVVAFGFSYFCCCCPVSHFRFRRPTFVCHSRRFGSQLVTTSLISFRKTTKSKAIPKTIWVTDTDTHTHSQEQQEQRRAKNHKLKTKFVMQTGKHLTDTHTHRHLLHALQSPR